MGFGRITKIYRKGTETAEQKNSEELRLDAGVQVGKSGGQRHASAGATLCLRQLREQYDAPVPPFHLGRGFVLPTQPLRTRLQLLLGEGEHPMPARSLHEGGAKPITPVSSMAQLAAAYNAGVSTPSSRLRTTCAANSGCLS